MSLDDEQRWIDESLREVRVPRELIARLKTVGEDHRSLLDGALCAVPVPASLLARLKDVRRDEVLDATLRSVPMPAALIDELKEVPVETRVGVTGQERRRWWERATSSRVSWLAAAAAVVFLVPTIILVQQNYQDVATKDPPPDSDQSATVAQPDRPFAPADETNDSTPSDDPVSRDVVAPVVVEATPSWPAAAAVDEPTPDSLAAKASPQRPIPDVLPRAPDSGADPPPHDVAGPPVHLGMPGAVREPPAVAQIAQPARRGITPPAVREYDLLSFAQDGIHPFVSPGAHPWLRSLRVPVVTATSSFEAALTAARAGKMLPAHNVRTEEFLAAVAAAPGAAGAETLGLAVTGGPSPWAEGRRQLLQITVWSDDRGDGHQPLAAEDVRLAVAFSPTAVRHYRLLGHEADIGGGLLAGPRENQLRVGDAATILFEVEFQPLPVGDLAEVALSWRIPDTGTVRERTRRIRRDQLSATFVEAAPSFQLATVAAATAELLRNSPYAASEFTHRDVITLADSVHPALYTHPRLLDLLDLLDAMSE